MAWRSRGRPLHLLMLKHRVVVAASAGASAATQASGDVPAVAGGMKGLPLLRCALPVVAALAALVQRRVVRSLTMADGHAGGEPPTRPRALMALPGRPEDHTVGFHYCLADILELTGVDAAPDNGTATWRSAARRAMRQELKERDHLPEELFGPLVMAGVYDPNPSSNRQFIEPAVTAFGRCRVKPP